MTEENRNELEAREQENLQGEDASARKDAGFQKEDMNKAIAYAEEENFGEAVKKIDEMEQKAQVPLTGEPFASSEPLTPQAEESLETQYEGRVGIEVEYDLKSEEISPALWLFQKRVIFKRNAIYTAILAVIFVLYVISLILSPSYGLGYFMVVVCATVAGFLWYLPYRHRKSTAAAMASVDDSFSLTVYDDSLLVGEGPSMYRLDYIKDQVKALARKDMMILMVGRERLFVLPLRCTGEEKMERLRVMLQNALGGNYIDESEYAAAEKPGKNAKAEQGTEKEESAETPEQGAVETANQAAAQDAPAENVSAAPEENQ